MSHRLFVSILFSLVPAISPPLTAAVAIPVSMTLAQTTSPSSVDTQLPTFAGTGMTMTACEERLAALDRALQAAGYGAPQRRTGTGTLMAVRWYHAKLDRTVLATVDLRASGSAIVLTQLPYQDHWNEAQL